MSFSFIQSASSVSVGSLAFSSSVAAGSMILVALGGFNGFDPSVVTVSDNVGDTFIKVVWTDTSQYPSCYALFVAFNAIGGATTVSATGMGTNTDIIICEYSLVSSYSWFTLSPYLETTPGSSPGGGIQLPPTDVPSDCLVIVSCYDGHRYHTWSAFNMTVRETTHEPDDATLGLADGIFTSLTSSTVGYLFGSSNSDNHGSIFVVAAASGGSGGLRVNPGTQGGCNA